MHKYIDNSRVLIWLLLFDSGNLDERVTERVLYDILIQAGRVVDLHIPKDKETEKPKGYAFAEYETEESADYAVRLFSGLVTLYNRTLKFAVCSQHLCFQPVKNYLCFSLNFKLLIENLALSGSLQNMQPCSIWL